MCVWGGGGLDDKGAAHIARLTRLSTGSVSLKKRMVMIMVAAAMVREKRAGYWNMVNVTSPSDRPRMEKRAPIMGPNRKPREKATPITA